MLLSVVINGEGVIVRSLWSWMQSAFGPMLSWFLPLLGGLVGILVGIMVFTFGYANGLAYFGHEAETCKQCHSMNEQYDAWTKGSHSNVATCQDCHNPNEDFVAYLIAEADNGFWHSLKFTTGNYPENIKIRQFNVDIVQENCLRCHSAITSDIAMTRTHNTQIDCLQCHSSVGHKR